MELGHWVTGSMGNLGHLSRTGRRVIILTRCETRDFPVFEKMHKMQNVHLKCWNDKSHCQVSVVRLKSLDVSPCNELLLLPMIIKMLWPENTSSHISRHLEFIIEQAHRVNWVSGSLDSRVTGSLGHKMWPSSISALESVITFWSRWHLASCIVFRVAVVWLMVNATTQTSLTRQTKHRNVIQRRVQLNGPIVSRIFKTVSHLRFYRAILSRDLIAR